MLKGLATGVSVIVASLCSAALFETALTFTTMIGAFMILGSVYGFHASRPRPESTSRREEEARTRNAEDSLVTPLLIV